MKFIDSKIENRNLQLLILLNFKYVYNAVALVWRFWILNQIIPVLTFRIQQAYELLELKTN